MRPIYRIGIFAAIFIWSSGILAECFQTILPGISVFFPFVKYGYSLVCHQDLHKLIITGCGHTLVCARCAGIYAGFFILSLASIFKDFRRAPGLKVFAIAVLPMVVDVALHNAGVYPYSHTTAFATGLLFGSITFLYFYAGSKKLLEEIKYRK